MEITLQDLPAEIQDITLKHLPLTDLLSFAITSRSNYQLAVQALTTLDLAIFPRKIHSILAFFDATNEEHADRDGEDDENTALSQLPLSSANRALYQIGLATPTIAPSLNAIPTLTSLTESSTRLQSKRSSPKPSRSSSSASIPSVSRSSLSTPPPTPLSLRIAEIAKQNSFATSILSTSTMSSLRHLTLRLYDMSSPQLSTILARRFPSMQSLSLDFCHPYIHDTTLPARYWKETPLQGSPVWNPLSGIGEQNVQNLNLRNLRTLKLGRANITSFQLRHWIQANPELCELQLSMCKGVDTEFTTWLAEYMTTGPGRGKLKTLSLHNCTMLELKHAESFAWINRLCNHEQDHKYDHKTHTTPLRMLSLSGCKNINDDEFCRLATDKMWCRGVRRLISPLGTALKATPAINLRTDSDIKSSNNNPLTTLIESKVHRYGSVSPALTVSDGMLGSGTDYFSVGKIEVDPTIEL